MQTHRTSDGVNWECIHTPCPYNHAIPLKEKTTNLKQHLISKAANAAGEERLANELVRGRYVRIIKDFRDQPWGSSKPNLKGKVFKVRNLFFSDIDGGCTLWLEGVRCGVSINEVEFV